MITRSARQIVAATEAQKAATEEAARLRAEAARLEREKEESFERCDTDGFMSQWASGVNAQKARLAADIAEQGGTWEFPALFDLDGNPVPAKLIETRYGWAWALLDPENTSGRFLGFFNESYARDEKRRVATNARKGYYVGTVRVPAFAKLAGGNVCTVTAVPVRRDGGWSVDAQIVDNGQR